MKPSIFTGFFERYTPEDAILQLRAAGFSYGEFVVDHSLQLLNRGKNVEKTGLQFRAFLEDQSFALPQGHLNFLEDLCLPETVEYLKREITLFQAIGVRNAVFHINGGLELPAEQRFEIQQRHIRELLDFVKGTDFTFCLENLMTTPTLTDADKLLNWIEILGGKNLGICLDTGHLHYSRLGLRTTEQTHVEFIQKAGKYLKATHIQSNDGSGDQHLAPYTGRKNPIDWPGIVAALREIGYDELFSLEVCGETETYPPLPILKAKLTYMKNLLDLMLSTPASTTPADL